MSSNVDYYLSSYLNTPGAESVLGARHDQSLALWACSLQSIELVRLWELERLSGQKHHYWPLFTPERAEHLIRGLLAEVGLRPSDIRATWGTPGLFGFSEIGVPAGAEDFPLHSIAHLFSGMLMDSRCFNEETIVALAMDGGPDFVLERTEKPCWYAGCVSVQGELRFAPVESPGYLYLTCAKQFGLEEGTLMALASACPTAVDFDVRGAVAGLDLHGGRKHPAEAASAWFEAVVEEARRRLAPSHMDDRFSPRENLLSVVMKLVQEACFHISARNIRKLLALGDLDPRQCHLSLTGGCALNCPTNSALMNAFGFRSLLTPPCPNDSGQSLGLGLLGLHANGEFRGRRFELKSAFHGSPALHMDAGLEEFAPWVDSVSLFDSSVFVRDIQEAPVIWVEGAAEIGPRALGHRSILADPRTMRSKSLLNKYKGRQWWRPIAPIVLEDETPKWFDMDRVSPYMLETAQVHSEMAGRVPAIVHLDRSARLQTLPKESSECLYEALQAFHAATGVPLLCNTSLNDKGEPIVGTAAQALNFCVRKGVEVAYINGSRVRLRLAGDGSPPAPEGPGSRATAHFSGQEGDRDRIWREWTRDGYTSQALFLLTRTPHLLPAGERSKPTREVSRLAAFAGRRHADFAAAAEDYEQAFGPGVPFSTRPWTG